jgi:hypothetical protein
MIPSDGPLPIYNCAGGAKSVHFAETRDPRLSPRDKPRVFLKQTTGRFFGIYEQNSSLVLQVNLEMRYLMRIMGPSESIVSIRYKANASNGAPADVCLDCTQHISEREVAETVACSATFNIQHF